MTEQNIPPCRCCGGQPEQGYLYGTGSSSPNPAHRCVNCGFMVLATCIQLKPELFENSETLWSKANEKHNPFIENK